MDSLIPTLLRALDAPGPFRPAPILREFLEAHRLGEWSGRRVTLTDRIKKEIRSILQIQHGVAPGATVQSWGATADRASDVERVEVKALEGHPVLLDGAEIWLPAQASLSLPVSEASRLAAHGAILLTSNPEEFQQVGLWAAGRAPGDLLVVCGDVTADASGRSLRQFLGAMARPIFRITAQGIEEVPAPDLVGPAEQQAA